MITKEPRLRIFLTQAVFRIADLGVSHRPSISVHTILGDSSSLLHIQPNQTFYIEYQEVTQRRSFPKVNFKVDYGGEVMLVSDFHISGNENPTFQLDGRITGVSNLTLTEGRVFLAGENASSALIKGKSYVEKPLDGKLSFGVFGMEAASQLQYTKHMELDIDTIYMRQRAVISADTIVMTMRDAHLEGSSNITTSGRGPEAGKGLGVGSYVNSIGSGAGHGGQGGPATTTSGGIGYGSYVYPVHPGSGGGGPSGGNGGSTIKVSWKEMFLDFVVVYASVQLWCFTNRVTGEIRDGNYRPTATISL